MRIKMLIIIKDLFAKRSTQTVKLYIYISIILKQNFNNHKLIKIIKMGCMQFINLMFLRI